MVKKILLVLFLSLIALSRATYASMSFKADSLKKIRRIAPDTVPSPDVLEVVRKAIYAANNFDVQAVANLYTPNAVVADDEPPYSWNGPTAGIQWVDAVEKACKDYHITKFKGSIEPVNVYQETAGNVYLIVPVNYTGNLPGHAYFSARGAFTFVLRQINDKWLIKSQVWMPAKGMN
ncbi:MAG: nuclear transport factor 2 family protein [Mucilaginibacter sp.]